MTIEERGLTAKYKLWKKFRDKYFEEKDVKRAIYSTGLSKKSRGLKTVIAYMRDYRHLGEIQGVYYIIYRRKDKANPRPL
jgi:hypothetical protein